MLTNWWTSVISGLGLGLASRWALIAIKPLKKRSVGVVCVEAAGSNGRVTIIVFVSAGVSSAVLTPAK